MKTWGKSDDKKHENKKFRNLSYVAWGLHDDLRSWCADNETDGRVPLDVARRKLSQHARGSRVAKIAAELVDAELWVEAGDGWIFHDWADYNETKEQRRARRDTDADRKRRSREQSRPVSDRDPSAIQVRSSCDPHEILVRSSEDETADQKVLSETCPSPKIEREKKKQPPTVVATTAVAVPATRWREINLSHDRDSLDGIMAGFRAWYRQTINADISDRSMPKWRGQVETGLRMGHPPDRCRNALAETVRRELGYGAFLTVLESIAGAGAPAMSTATQRASAILALAEKFDAEDAATTGSLRIIHGGEPA